jgi:uncharacterized protein YaiI (UPF0178 family)
LKTAKSNGSKSERLTIWIDADACPKAIKDLLFRTAQKRELKLILVANQTVYAPASQWISVLTVPQGADQADDRIADHVQENDIVVTGDIPLASRVIAKGAVVIGLRGELLDESSIGQALAARNLMDYLRSSGLQTSGPSALGPGDMQNFANQLDRLLTRLI